MSFNGISNGIKIGAMTSKEMQPSKLPTFLYFRMDFGETMAEKIKGIINENQQLGLKVHNITYDCFRERLSVSLKTKSGYEHDIIFKADAFSLGLHTVDKIRQEMKKELEEHLAETFPQDRDISY